MRKRYVRVQLPEELTDFVAYVASKRLLGYRSLIEFVCAAVRKEVQYLQELNVLPPVVPRVKSINPGAIGVLSAVILVAMVGLLTIVPGALTGFGVLDDALAPLSRVDFAVFYAQYGALVNFVLYLVVFFAICYAATKQRFDRREALLIAGVFAFALAMALSIMRVNWMRQLSPLALLLVALALLYALFEGLREFGFRGISSGSIAYVLAYLLVRTHAPDLFEQAGGFGSVLSFVFLVAFLVAAFKACSELWDQSEPWLVEAQHAARLAWNDKFGTPEQKELLAREQAAVAELLKIEREEFKRVTQLGRDLSKVEDAIRKYGYSRDALATIADELGKLRGQETELAKRLQEVYDLAEAVESIDIDLFTNLKGAFQKLSGEEQAQLKKVIQERVSALQLTKSLEKLVEAAREARVQLDTSIRDACTLLEKRQAHEALRTLDRARYHVEQLRAILKQAEDVEQSIQILLGRSAKWFATPDVSTLTRVR